MNDDANRFDPIRADEGRPDDAPSGDVPSGDAPSDAAPRDDRTPLVAVLMGSASDWDTMREADDVLREFAVPHVCRVVSAHRTPDRLRDVATAAAGQGTEVIIAGAGGAAHLPGMLAAWTRLPVLGVPVRSRALSGSDSLLSIVQMPRGVPVGTLAIGGAGAANAALLAVRILALRRPQLARRLERHARAQAEASEASELPTPDYRP